MSRKLRWSKMWWQDWSNDPGLRLCSLAAQGLWMRMLCLAADQPDDLYGNVLINRNPPTPGQLAKIVGIHHVTIGALLRELERNGVCDRTPANVYQSRRMIREKALQDASYIAGKRGGNPALMPWKQTEQGKETVNPPHKSGFNLQEAEAEPDKGKGGAPFASLPPKQEPSPTPPTTRGRGFQAHLSVVKDEPDGS
jgi:hypothetical protein